MCPVGSEESDGLRFGILGPLVAMRSNQPLTLGGRQQRAVLAMLLADVGKPVSVDRLAAELWSDQAPPGYITTIQTYVFHLRAALEPERPRRAPNSVLLTDSGGYRLQVPSTSIDAAAFEALVIAGQRLLTAGDAAGAIASLESALAMWRGAVLLDLDDFRFVAPLATRLNEIRKVAEECRIDAKLLAGQHASVVGELDRLIAADPLRERLHAQRMLALYRAGRQADALAAYQDLRQTLDDELGIEPSPEAEALQRSMLNHDAQLDWKPAPEHGGPTAVGPAAPAVPSTAAPRKPSRRPVLAVAVAVVALAAAAVTVVAVRGRSQGGLRSVDPNSVAAMSDHGSLNTATAIGGNPDGIAYGDGSVWLVDRTDGSVRRLNPHAHTSLRIQVGDQPESIAASGNNVWVANFGSRNVSWINTTSNTVVQTIPVGNQPAAVAVGPAGVWVANSGDDTIQKIDPNTGTAGPAIGVGDGPAALAVGDDTVWVANARDGTVSRVDTHAGATLSGPIFVGSGPRGLALTPDGVWVANSLSQTVDRINPGTGQIDRTIMVGDGPSAVAATSQAVWVANEFDGTVARIDARSGAWRRYAVGSSPVGLATDGKKIWLATGALGGTAHSGGTLIVAGRPVPGDFVGIDPANAYVQFVLEAERPVYDGLVGMREIGGLAGQTLVPDLAVALPRPSPDGRSYTFTIRPGIRYSTGRQVLAEDFRRGLARALRGQGRPDFYTKVIGAPACIADLRACGLSQGVDTDNARHRVTFHLTARDPDFLYKLTYFVFPMPSDVPLTVQRKPIPGTGPYQISADYRERLVAPGDVRAENFSLVRNPHFHQWSFAAQPAGYPDVIRFQPTSGAVEAADLVLAGKADLTHPNNFPDSKPMPDGYVASLARQYPALIRPERLAETDYLNLNTQLRPFNDLRARQAVDYALDRKAVQSLIEQTFPDEPTCQLLPPDFPGFQPYCPWTANPSPDGSYHGPDLAKAQRLVAASGTRGTPVLVHTLVGNPEQRLMGYVTEVLKKLGYRARLEVLPVTPENYNRPADPRSGVQVSLAGWGADFPRPATFYDGLLDCASYHRSPSENANIPEFCDRSLDQAVANATALEPTDPGAAVHAFAEIDRRVTDEAPIVPYGSSIEPFLLSTRLGNFQFSPYTGPLLSQAWVK